MTNEMTNKIKDLENKVLSSVSNYTKDPKEVLQLLDFCDKFSNYSFNNQVLILAQRSSAIAVASFTTFKKLGYHVLKGEKAIKILVPYKSRYIVYNHKYLTVKEAKKQNIAFDDDDIQEHLFFNWGSVFEVTQTDMPKEEYPKLYPNRHQDYVVNDENSDILFHALQKIASEKNIKVITDRENEAMLNGALGVFIPSQNKICLSYKNTPSEMVDVLIHELAHGFLHNTKGKFYDVSYNMKELQAEMTAFIVAKHCGIDTTDKTISYISGWTEQGKLFFNLDDKEKANLLNGISNVSKHFIKVIDDALQNNDNNVEQAL